MFPSAQQCGWSSSVPDTGFPLRRLGVCCQKEVESGRCDFNTAHQFAAARVGNRSGRLKQRCKTRLHQPYRQALFLSYEGCVQPAVAAYRNGY